MANVKGVILNGTKYESQDTEARALAGQAINQVETLKKTVTDLESGFTNLGETVANVNQTATTAKTTADEANSLAQQAETRAQSAYELADAAGHLIGRNLIAVLGAANAADAFAALRTRADDGNFSGLRKGDYIDVPSMTIDGSAISNSNQRLRFEIAGFDTYLNVGDTPVTSHHILMISKNCVLQKTMNSTAKNAGGYAASELCAYLNNQVKTGLVNAIGITPKTVHRLLDTKGGWAWLAETVFIPTEVEVFGHQAWSNNKGYSTGTSVQWPLFSEFPQRRIANWNGSRWWYWEASPQTDDSASFCVCDNSGNATYTSADNSIGGVRFGFLV